MYELVEVRKNDIFTTSKIIADGESTQERKRVNSEV